MGNYGLGTLGGGVCYIDPQTELFHPGLALPDSLNNLIPKWVNDIFIDKHGNFWVGTYDGLVYADLAAQTIQIFTTDDGFMPHNVVYCILPDSAGNLWIGTLGGLAKIDPKNLTSTIYDKSDGLASNVICAMHEDENHLIWMSTHNGLSRFDPTNGAFTNYFASDGLQSNEFSRKAAFKSSKNELFFGGINGITEIKKDYQNYSRPIRDVMLTDLLRYDKPVKIGDKSGKHFILNKSIVLADTIKLVERDNVFSIGFTSVELANQSRISYKYKWKGLI